MRIMNNYRHSVRGLWAAGMFRFSGYPRSPDPSRMAGYSVKDSLNHRIPPGAAVQVRREGAGAIPGEVAGIAPDGSYLVRIGTGRAAQTIRARAIQVTRRELSATLIL